MKYKNRKYKILGNKVMKFLIYNNQKLICQNK